MGTSASRDERLSQYLSRLQKVESVIDSHYGNIDLMQSPPQPTSATVSTTSMSFDLNLRGGVIAMKQRKFQFEEEVSQQLTALKQQHKHNHPHLVKILDYFSSSEESFCTSVSRIVCFMEYVRRDLATEIRSRKLLHDPFSRNELLSIVLSCISVFAHLQRLRIHFGDLRSSNILLTTSLEVKLLNPVLFKSQPLFTQALHEPSIPKSTYLSPALLEALNSNTIPSKLLSHKSEVFALGFVLMEACLLEEQDDCFKKKDSTWTVDAETVRTRLSIVSEIYGDDIASIIIQMTELDEKKRPDFADLEKQLELNKEMNKTMDASHFLSNRAHNFSCESDASIILKSSSAIPTQSRISYSKSSSMLFLPGNGTAAATASVVKCLCTDSSLHSTQTERLPPYREYALTSRNEKNFHRLNNSMQRLLTSNDQRGPNLITQKQRAMVFPIRYSVNFIEEFPVSAAEVKKNCPSLASSQIQDAKLADFVSTTKPLLTQQQLVNDIIVVQRPTTKASATDLQQSQQSNSTRLVFNKENSNNKRMPFPVNKSKQGGSSGRNISSTDTASSDLKVLITSSTKPSTAQKRHRVSGQSSLNYQSAAAAALLAKKLSSSLSQTPPVSKEGSRNKEDFWQHQRKSSLSQSQSISQFYQLDSLNTSKHRTEEDVLQCISTPRVSESNNGGDCAEQQQPLEEEQSFTKLTDFASRNYQQFESFLNPIPEDVIAEGSRFSLMPPRFAESPECSALRKFADLSAIGRVPETPMSVADGTTPINAATAYHLFKQSQITAEKTFAEAAVAAAECSETIWHPSNSEITPNMRETPHVNGFKEGDPGTKVTTAGRKSIILNDGGTESMSSSSGKMVQRNNNLTHCLLTQLILDVEETYEDGAVYVGEKMNGKRHGQGLFSYADGGQYEGTWQEGSMEGFGRLFYPSGKLAYEGEWKEDRFSGLGTVYNNTPLMCNVDDFDFHDLNLMGERWVKYEGSFKNDLKHGQGILHISDGLTQIHSLFVNDQAQGQAVISQNLSNQQGELLVLYHSNRLLQVLTK